MLDMHSHVLYGVDDGARDLEESLAMLAAAAAAGVTQLVCTPHMRGEASDPAVCVAPFEALLPRARGMGIQLIMGYELNCDVLAYRGLKAADRYRIQGTQLLLLEFAFSVLPGQWERMLDELLLSGLQVVIAHPERYTFVQRDGGLARAMVDLGCSLQLDAQSLFGPLFGAERKAARELMRAGLIEYVASDAHEPSAFAALARAYRMADEKRWKLSEGIVLQDARKQDAARHRREE